MCNGNDRAALERVTDDALYEIVGFNVRAANSEVNVLESWLHQCVETTYLLVTSSRITTLEGDKIAPARQNSWR